VWSFQIHPLQPRPALGRPTLSLGYNASGLDYCSVAVGVPGMVGNNSFTRPF
jgi:hypothetical protein